MKMIEKFMLTGKTVIITGGAGSIGSAVANDMVEMGANIVVADVNEAAAQGLAGTLCQKGSNSIGIGVDITCEAEVQNVVDTTIKKYGKIDVLFNNAGCFSSAPSLELSYQDWCKVIDINLNGAFLMTKAVGKEMMLQRSGSVVTTASMSGVIVNYPRPQSAYNASKAGLVQMMRTFAMEWAPYNIRVNCVSPGYIDNVRLRNRIAKEMIDFFNEITPMHRMCFPEEISGAVIYLASDAASYTTGVNLLVDGGYTIL